MTDRTALADYIESLEAAGNKLTREEWLAWIEEEEKDFAKQDERFKPLTDLEKSRVLDALEEDGYIK